MGEIISGERRLDTAALMERAARAAAGLASLGVGRGDMVALYLRNDLPFFEASFAAGLLGAYPTPVNWHYTEDEARYLFENSGARAIVIHADLLEPVRSAFPDGVPVLVVETPPEVAEAYGIAPERRRRPGRHDRLDRLARGLPAPYGRRRPGAGHDHLHLRHHRPAEGRAPPPAHRRTGGPRRADPRPHLRLPGLVEHPETIVTVVTGPMYHSAPNAYGLIAARLGAKVILQPRFDRRGAAAPDRERAVTHLHMVPIMFNRLLKLPDEVKARYDLSSLQFVVHAAAPCPAPTKRAMIEWWGPVINEYYGATETGSSSSAPPRSGSPIPAPSASRIPRPTSG